MTQSELKELKAIGAELGAAKAENEKLRGLLTTAWRLRPDQHYHEDHLQAEQKAWEVETAEVLNAADALPQQAEPTDAFTAVDMATAAAQGFRDGQAAVEQAPVQDEREAVERFSPTTSVPHCGRASEVEAYMTEDDDGEYMTVAQHERIVAALTRPAQTEQQPYAWATEREGDPTFPRLHKDEHQADHWVQVCNVAPPIIKRPLYAAPNAQTAPRCQCCGYLVTDSEHRGCLRAATPSPAKRGEA